MGIYSMSITDSVTLLGEEIAREASYLFAYFRNVLAIVGMIYVAYKVSRCTSRIVEAIQMHLIGQRSDKWVEKYGPWAVVTGGSEGVGHAYAYELAARGLNIVLLSRNESKLKAAKADIESSYPVTVEYIVADFASEAQTELYKKIEQKLADKDVGLLVNNVGVMYDYPDVLLNISSEKLWQLIHVNIGAATMMTHMLLPQMIKRGKGGIVVISSGSATHATPHMTVYSATKRYLDCFIQGLAYEYRNSGITFQCLVPFFIVTSMMDYSKILTHLGMIAPSAAVYAKSAVGTLGQSFCTAGYFPHTLQLWIAKAVPNWLWMWGSEKVNSFLRREALDRNELQQQKGDKDKISKYKIEINREQSLEQSH
ncbi:unnamed protein product [Candidula unifasciata]|uniref:Inactive hydroxysteroid dehydrogenase-like protein 1 n=1 Tax=Candidula unifasciata TaxID=100452 RepID=A0A8S3ZVU9_9EUPU|nr:unnamed protein product [Candidula unifasciata]